ncbi:MAG: D-glycerate dehydrogenase, partial [Bacillota bacterium]|nr:D-glycerate dehydrogenase [Bacillota bacterium]
MSLSRSELNKPRILITRRIPEEALAILNRACEIEQWPEVEQPMPRGELLKKVQNVDGLYTLLTDRVDIEVLNEAKRLKIVSNMAVGYDNIDVAACSARGIMVTNTPGVLTETTADLAMALLLATSRRIVEASNYLRQGKWNHWFPMQMTGQDVFGATLGIIGLGRIGEAVAKRAKGFDMNIIYNNRTRNMYAEKELGASYRQLDELLAESDFVLILTPLTAETRNMIGKRELALMKPTGILLNC